MKCTSYLLLALLTLASGCLMTGCATGMRTQSDETIQSDNGLRARGPRINFGNLFGVSLLAIDTKVKTAVEEPAVVVAGSVLSKTGLKDFAADTKSKRGSADLGKTVEYGIKDLNTEAQAEAIKEFMAPLSDIAKAYLSTLTGPAAAIMAAPEVARDDKASALLKLLPADAPSAVKTELEKQ